MKFLFCPVCGNILIPENGLGCQSCPYIYALTNQLTTKTTLKTKQNEDILGGEDQFKYATKCAKRCPNCANNEALFMEIQTRSADEPSTLFYCCTKCSHDWKEN